MANRNEYNPGFYGAEYNRGVPFDTSRSVGCDRMNHTDMNRYYQNRGMIPPDVLSNNAMRMGDYQTGYMQDNSGIMLPWDNASSEAERDMEYFQSMYPTSMKRLKVHVEEVCDKMEYEGSPMYDEYPDRVALQRICHSICRRIMEEEKQMPGPELDEEVEEVEVYEATSFYPGGAYPYWPPRDPYPYRPNDNWFPDIISLLLYNEIYRRRRCRNCRQRFY